MYPLDSRETNILRHALGRDGSSEALDLLGLIPDAQAGSADLSPRQTSVAVQALDGYAKDNSSFGAIAVTLAADLRRHSSGKRA